MCWGEGLGRLGGKDGGPAPAWPRVPSASPFPLCCPGPLPRAPPALSSLGTYPGIQQAPHLSSSLLQPLYLTLGGVSAYLCLLCSTSSLPPPHPIPGHPMLPTCPMVRLHLCVVPTEAEAPALSSTPFLADCSGLPGSWSLRVG